MNLGPMLRAAASAGLVWVAAGAADAQAARTGPLTITKAWVRATPSGATTAAAYLTVTNAAATPDRLLGGTAPGVGSISPHSMSMAGGVMRMRELPEGLEIPAEATVGLAPGGNHLMLAGFKGGLRPGQRLPMTLSFAKAGRVRIIVPVRTGPP